MIASLLKQSVSVFPIYYHQPNTNLAVFSAPNIKKLTLNFVSRTPHPERRFRFEPGSLIAHPHSITQSGHLHSYSNCLGTELLDALCNLKKIEEFHQGRTTSTRTDLGGFAVMKLVASWPKLRTVRSKAVMHYLFSNDDNIWMLALHRKRHFHVQRPREDPTTAYGHMRSGECHV